LEEPIDTLIRQMHGDLKVVVVKVEELAGHVAAQNGRLSLVEGQQRTQNIHTARIEGAVSFGRWLLAATLSVMTVGVGIAGLILGYVLRGG